ncbi:hypothetical protein [Burkholderia cepacia]|uniref:hypothetical protein n=1 Tax=Burkholderia cepacia TaxID=292 RepID=UPI000AA9E49E|nr:hypothetical protein [Burkholderia cepacia]
MNEINEMGQSPRATRHLNIGDWLWCELMDYCKERGIPAANSDRLFAIVGRARAAWDTKLKAATESASDALKILEMIDAADHAVIPSGLRLTIDAALIKAGRKEAPEPVRHVTIAGVRNE